jgi:hypothetical protein
MACLGAVVTEEGLARFGRRSMLIDEELSAPK